MKTEIVELRIQVTGLQRTIEGLTRKVTMFEEELATKADITHVQLINKQSEIIKKSNDSKSIPMDCKVGVSLDGRVVAESIVEHTADSIKCGVIKGSEINETR
ncbi:hypothetical protein BK751_10265 [Bacillus thuringiensis serovar galleriae]|nr:hypothetical protein Waukesha92_72 [Bacillus phage Waukesha92]OTY69358.1 hypothetical protein BK747_11415 [Bacillus thuringiensis serovar azorensis]OTY77864.1 hypothetical protein BK755_31885 [Bacillus thuringiensis serovar aizawai]OTY82903.1 hypothetical protein BK754_31400 [Bacillus thuringiensis serovar subtoxicus]OTY91187.1 hypothetical protein BK751_10265 [Bacillus thuringiensis serovar galleriae]OTZ40436.1 hypothetical protein BK760_13775 [Bacillus thuringiensis serovar tolworthi]OUA